jgi:hypothetical protein
MSKFDILGKKSKTTSVVVCPECAERHATSTACPLCEKCSLTIRIKGGKLCEACIKKQDMVAQKFEKRELLRKANHCDCCDHDGHQIEKCPNRCKGKSRIDGSLCKNKQNKNGYCTDCNAEYELRQARRSAPMKCNYCHKDDHIVKNCPQLVCPCGKAQKILGEKVCETCKQNPVASIGVCRYCKEEGHIVKDCPQLMCPCGKAQKVRGERSCEVCIQRQDSKEVCKNCKTKGHHVKNCGQLICQSCGTSKPVFRTQFCERCTQAKTDRAWVMPPRPTPEIVRPDIGDSASFPSP